MDHSTIYQKYINLGWALVPIHLGVKHPVELDWNERAKCVLPPGWGQHGESAGLAHAYCREPTCSIDTDQLAEALGLLRLGYQVDLQRHIDAPDAVWIIGNPVNHQKLLYRMPPGLILPTKAIKFRGRHAIQFRCATTAGLTVQDVLPPSWHPDVDRPYRWGGAGSWEDLPELPQDLREVWIELCGGPLAVMGLDPGRPYPSPGPRLGSLLGQIPEHNDETTGRIVSMLTVLDPDMPRDDWLNVGMAVHSVSENLFDVWDAWSRRGTKYDTPGQPSAADVWRSFSSPDALGPGAAVTFGTLRRLAYRAGWRDIVDTEALYRAAGLDGEHTPGCIVDPTPAAVPAPEAGITGPSDGSATAVQGLTYDQLMEQARLLTPMDSPRDILAAAVNLTPTEQDRVIVEVSDKTHIGRQALRRELAQLGRAARRDDDQDGGAVPAVLQPLFASFCHVGQLDVLFQPSTRSYYKPMAFEHAYQHLHEDVLELALDGGVVKVDRIDYVPGQPPLFDEDGVRYINIWTGVMNRGREGDCTPWLEHFQVMGFEAPDVAHLLQWMAFTLRHPERKINHGVILSGLEGVGKDAVFYPLDRALSENATIMDAVALFSDFNAELLGRKLVRINETALGGERHSRSVEEKLKPMLATPPDRVWINEKGIAKWEVRNVFNVAISTNSYHPLHISTGSRRYFALRSELDIQDERGNVTPEWKAYWKRFWAWMDGQRGWEHCVWYLMNQVDLVGFEPGLAPPSTEFKRQIQADSMGEVEAAIAELLETREGVFSLPLIMARDVHEMFAWGRQNNTYVVRYGMNKPPTASQIGKAVRDARLCRVGTHMGINRETGLRGRHQIWVIEEPPGYDKLSGSQKVDLYNQIMVDYWKQRSDENVSPLK